MTAPLASPYLFFFRPSVNAPVGRVFSALTGQRAYLPGTPHEVVPDEGFEVHVPEHDGSFQYKLLSRGDRTIVDVKFFSRNPVAREKLDRMAAKTAWTLAALKADLEHGTRLSWEEWARTRPSPPATARIVRRSDFVWEASVYPDDPEPMGDFASLTKPVGATQIGADISRLLPGQRSTRLHCETDEEEAFLILSGRCHVEIEGEVHVLETGDFVFTFPGDAHFFWNDFDDPCEFLGFGGADLAHNGAIYQHGKDLDWRTRLDLLGAETPPFRRTDRRSRL